MNVDLVLVNIRKVFSEIREVRRYSQEYVGGELGINQNTYSKVESGQTEMTLRRFLQLCDVLEVEPLQLLAGALGALAPVGVEVAEQPLPDTAKMQAPMLVRKLPTAADLLFAVVEIGRTLREMGGESDGAGEPSSSVWPAGPGSVG